MTKIETIENKLSTVEKYLKILKLYQKYSQKKVVNDVTLKGAVERYLYLVIQATIELAEEIVSLKHFRKPSSYRETFQVLLEEEIISAPLCERLVKMTGFRNIIAHDYEKVDFGIVYAGLQNGIKDITAFSLAVKKKLKLR